jgi:ATP-dependent protease ClpP protease subunit
MIRLPSNLTALRAAWRVTSEVPARSAPCFRVSNATDTPKIYVYDVIGGWDLDSGEFVQAVHGIDAKALDLHINSPGGFVYDAVAMFEALQTHPATVNVHIDGLAASAASFLAQAGDSVDIAKGGRMMIHDAQGIGIGSPADMREYADLLDAVSDDISGYYAARAGGKPAAWRTAMKATTWYSATEAVDAGLADRVAGADKKTSGASNRSRLIKARAAIALGGVK